MKTFAIPFLLGLSLYCAPLHAQINELKEHVSKTFTLTREAAETVLSVYNVNGFIKVEGYRGNTVRIEVEKTITGKTEADLAKGKQELQLAFDQQADSLTVYIAAPFDSRPNRNKAWNRTEPGYDFRLDYTIQVPQGMNLHVGTINQGDVTIENVSGTLVASNINGAVKIMNARGATRAHTINGSVVANYLAVPSGESDFKTLNGDIRITYPDELSADCQFKSFNGEFFTDFPNAAALPVKVVKHAERTSASTRFKLSTETTIRIGDGGRVLRFETFNGNIYLKKQS